jgi:hypothetical protein
MANNCSNKDSKILDEHFWFTAITLGFNTFIIDKLDTKLNNNWIIIAAFIINIYAIFLILHRAAAHSDRLKLPIWLEDMDENKKSFYHKGVESLFNLWTSIKMIPIVIFELSGAFFFILLIIFSFLGIFIVK